MPGKYKKEKDIRDAKLQVTPLKWLLWTFLFYCNVFTVTGILATQSLWQGATNSWGTGGNWTNGVPTGIAEFGNLGSTSIVLTQNTAIAQLLFNVNASAYTINTSGKTLTLTTGITNNSGQPQTITNSTPAKSTLTFQSGAIVGGGVTINNVTSGSIIAFTGNSSANSATITNAASCTVDISGLGALTPTITIGNLSGAGAVTLGSRSLIIGGGGLNNTVSGIISGAGGAVTKIGPETLTLSGTNTYTGQTIVNAGILQLGKANALATATAVTVSGGAILNQGNFAQSVGSLDGSGNVTLGSGTITTGNNNADTTFSGVMSGTGGLTKVGSGAFTLSGANTYTGATTVNAGTLRTAVANALAQTTPATVAAGATLDLNNNDQMIGSLAGAGSATLGSANLTTGYANTNATFTGALSGTGGLTKVGTGTFTLSGTNTYTGSTTINAGTLRMGKANALATATAVTVSGGAILNQGNFAQSIGSLDGSGGVTLGSGTITTGNNNADTTFSGVMSGTGGITKVGTGTFILSGTNTFTGATIVNAGTLQMGKANALATGTAVTVGAGTTFNLGGFAQSIKSLDGSGNVTLGSGTLTTGNSNSSTIFTGEISGTGGVTKVGTGIFTLSNNNTYTGMTTINAGTLRTSVTNVLPQTNAVTVAAGATLNLNGNDQRLGSLAGAGNAALGSAILTTGFANTNTTFSGVLSGTGGLTKVGTGTFILSGTNTYTGPTTLSEGILQLGKANALATGTALTVGAGTTFNLGGFAQSIGSLSGSGIVTLGASVFTLGNDNTNTTYSGVASGTGSLIKTGTGNLTLAGVNTYSGGTTIGNGTVSVAADNNLGAANTRLTFGTVLTAGTLKNTAALSSNRPVTLNQAGGIFDTSGGNLTLSGIISGAGSLIKQGVNVLTLSGVSIYTGSTTIGNGTVIVGADNNLGAANKNLNLGSASTSGTLHNTAAITTNRPIFLDQGGGIFNVVGGNLTLGGSISGPGSLTKEGANTLIILGANKTYSGGTFINLGALQAGIANCLSQTGTITVGAGTTFNLANFSQIIGSLAGSGNVIFGTGILTIGNDNNDTLFSGVMSGTGGLTKTGTGTLTLSGGNIYSGGTTISNGTISITADNNLGAANGTLTLGSVGAGGTLQNTGSFSSNRLVTLLQGGGVFDAASATTLTLTNIIGGVGSLAKEGLGTLIISGLNNYLGSTSINGGILQMGRTNAIPQTSAVTVANSATLHLANFNQNIGSLNGSGDVTSGSAVLTLGNDNTDSTFSGVMSGMGGLNKIGTGTFSISGANTHSGSTTISGGKLRAEAINTFSPNSAFTIGLGSILDLNNFKQIIASLAGAGNITLGSGILTTGGDNSSTGYSGALSGTGGFTKVGTGTFILSGGNTYSGLTTIIGGILRAGALNTFSPDSAIVVGAGSTLDLNNHDQEIASLTGPGNVSLGSGILTTGNDDTDTTFSGFITGTGGLTKTGTGIFTLQGSNTYSGGTMIALGTLQGNSSSLQGPINIGPLGKLIFNQDVMDGTYNGALSGAGVLEKQGSGRLTLSGANPFMGPINIRAGTLLANYTSLGVPVGGVSTLTVYPGGTLMGDGPIHQMVMNNGFLSVGNPMQTGFETLILKNGYQGSGTLQFNIYNSGDHSKLVSENGNIDLRQTTLSFATSDFINTMQTYDLIEVQNLPLDAVFGPFQSIPNRVGKFIPTIAYTPSTVQLSFDLEPTNFAQESKPGNDRSVANYLDNLSGSAEGSLEKFIFQLEGLTTSQRDDVFNQLNSASQASMSKSLGLGSLVVSMAQGRMRNLAGRQTGNASAAPAAFTSIGNTNSPAFLNSLTADRNAEPAYHSTKAALVEDNAYHLPLGNGKGGVWVQSFAISNQQKTTQGITGFGARSGGLMAGVDTQLSKTNFHVGAAVGFGRGKVSFKQARGTSKINSRLASIYSIYATKDFYVDAALGCGLNRYRNNRQLPSLGKTAESVHRATEWTPHLGGGVNFKLQETSIQPFVNVDFLYLREGGYTESNADFANLTVLSNSSSQWRGETGLNISRTFSFTDGNWTLLGKLSYIRKQPHKSDTITSKLVGQATTFETEALTLKQNEISPGVGFKLNLKNGFFITARYDAELSTVSTVQEVGIRLGYAF